MSNPQDREFQLAVAKTQSLSDWVNSLLAILGSVVLALGVLFATPFLSSGLSIDERVVFLPNAGLMVIAGALLFLVLIIFNLGYMRTRWSGLHNQFVGNNGVKSHPETPKPKKQFFDGAIFFYGLFIGIITGTLGNLFATVVYDYAKEQNNFDLVSALRDTTIAFIAVSVAFGAVSIYLWRKSRKA